ncbi:MAG: phosphoribosylformylglycinamidine cyclo-ligase [Alphaproteobacteria bacterium]|nr:phosphoribosylformylglycinamidine cyclo-ligase [Alphaproteobacteria bacterium]
MEPDAAASAYRASGVDIPEADAGLAGIVRRITATWPAAGQPGAVQLPIGYFANVIDIGGVGLGICTDGVGSKAIVAQMMGKYDTIGIDCVAMNVNDLLCVGAKPISMVDYIATDRAEAAMLDGIGVGLAEGARQSGISICGGEIAQLRDVVRGFDLVGMAVGVVPLDRIVVGRDVRPGDLVIGLDSSGIHSNGLSLARRVFFEQAGVSVEHVFAELGVALGEELLRPTRIYVSEIVDLLRQIPSLKALAHITGDGLMNLPRIAAEGVGFVLDALPPPPPIFGLIESLGRIERAEMFEIYNMGVGFCVTVGPDAADRALAVLASHQCAARVIGRAVADPEGAVRLPREGLVGRGKRFRRE